jgi:hypothetical protein
MNKRIVYRWQDKDGDGPYGSGLSFSTGHNDEAHPTPLQDKNPCSIRTFAYRMTYKTHGENIARKIYFGFDSMEQMNKWFTASEQKEMCENGFNLVKIEVNEEYIHRFGKQVMFYSRINPSKLCEII